MSPICIHSKVCYIDNLCLACALEGHKYNDIRTAIIRSRLDIITGAVNACRDMLCNDIILSTQQYGFSQVFLDLCMKGFDGSSLIPILITQFQNTQMDEDIKARIIHLSIFQKIYEGKATEMVKIIRLPPSSAMSLLLLDTILSVAGKDREDLITYISALELLSTDPYSCLLRTMTGKTNNLIQLGEHCSICDVETLLTSIVEDIPLIHRNQIELVSPNISFQSYLMNILPSCLTDSSTVYAVSHLLSQTPSGLNLSYILSSTEAVPRTLLAFLTTCHTILLEDLCSIVAHVCRCVNGVHNDIDLVYIGCSVVACSLVLKNMDGSITVREKSLIINNIEAVLSIAIKYEERTLTSKFPDIVAEIFESIKWELFKEDEIEQMVTLIMKGLKSCYSHDKKDENFDKLVMSLTDASRMTPRLILPILMYISSLDISERIIENIVKWARINDVEEMVPLAIKELSITKDDEELNLLCFWLAKKLSCDPNFAIKDENITLQYIYNKIIMNEDFNELSLDYSPLLLVIKELLKQRQRESDRIIFSWLMERFRQGEYPIYPHCILLLTKGGTGLFSETFCLDAVSNILNSCIRSTTIVKNFVREVIESHDYMEETPSLLVLAASLLPEDSREAEHISFALHVLKYLDTIRKLNAWDDILALVKRITIQSLSTIVDKDTIQWFITYGETSSQLFFPCVLSYLLCSEAWDKDLVNTILTSIPRADSVNEIVDIPHSPKKWLLLGNIEGFDTQTDASKCYTMATSSRLQIPIFDASNVTLDAFKQLVDRTLLKASKFLTLPTPSARPLKEVGVWVEKLRNMEIGSIQYYNACALAVILGKKDGRGVNNYV